MKRIAAILGVALIVVASSAFSQQPTSAPPPHSGILDYQRIMADNQPNNNYHIGGYVCVGGDSHYGPDCVPEVVTPQVYERATLILDDGRKLDVRTTSLVVVDCPMFCTSEIVSVAQR